MAPSRSLTVVLVLLRQNLGLILRRSRADSLASAARGASLIREEVPWIFKPWKHCAPSWVRT